MWQKVHVTQQAVPAHPVSRGLHSNQTISLELNLAWKTPSGISVGCGTVDKNGLASRSLCPSSKLDASVRGGPGLFAHPICGSWPLHWKPCTWPSAAPSLSCRALARLDSVGRRRWLFVLDLPLFSLSPLSGNLPGQHQVWCHKPGRNGVWSGAPGPGLDKRVLP